MIVSPRASCLNFRSSRLPVELLLSTSGEAPTATPLIRMLAVSAVMPAGSASRRSTSYAMPVLDAVCEIVSV